MIQINTNSRPGETQVNTTYSKPVENMNSRIIKAPDFAVSVTGNDSGISLYEGQGLNIEDVMTNAGAIDVTTNRNYMTVMSHSLSDEDYKELMEEGYKPGEISVETTVTVTDL